MEQSTVYTFSKGMRRAKKLYAYLAVALPIIFIVTILFITPVPEGVSPFAIAGIGLFASVLIDLVFYFSASRTLRRLSELSVSILSDRLERKDIKQKEVFFWKDLFNVEILENPHGEINSIKLAFADKKVITLFGFEDMEAATKQIEKYIPTNAVLQRKRARINWDNPAMITLTSVLPAVVMLAILKVSADAFYYFNIIVGLALGVSLLIARPISRIQGKGRKNFETTLGVAAIVLSVLLLSMRLFYLR